MSTTRRTFIRQSLSVASAGLLLPRIGEGADAPPCKSLDAASDIRILFSGLMLFRFDPSGFCDVEILNRHSDHGFSIEVEVKEGQNTPYTVGEHHGPLGKGLELKVHKPKPGTEGVCKFVPTARFSRSSSTNDEHDLRWALHLKEFHNPEPDFWKDHVLPGIRFFNGHFYTDSRTSPRITISRECGSTKDDLTSVASLIGANIYLDSGGAATLDGLAQPILMPQGKGLTYEIKIRNQPPIAERPSPGTKYRSHFHKYYSAMVIPPAQKCEIFYQSVSTTRATITGTPDVPCMGLIVGG